MDRFEKDKRRENPSTSLLSGFGSWISSVLVDPRQILAGFLTFTMFAMLAHMIKREHFDSKVYLFLSHFIFFISFKFIVILILICFFMVLCELKFEPLVDNCVQI